MKNKSTILIQHASVRLADGWLSPASIFIEDGKIKSISLESNHEVDLPSASICINANGKVAIPGLVNGHTHFSQAFMRGLAGGRPLLKWLQELIWPLQAAMSVEELQLASLLTLAENLRGGVTSVINHHKVTSTRSFTQAVEDAIQMSGMRATIARAWVNKGKNAEQDRLILDELGELLALNKSSSRITYASGPLTPWRATAALLQETHQLARENGSFTHIHVSETNEEVKMSLDEYGLRPIAWLNDIGVLDQDTQVVHSVWVDEAEIAMMKKQECCVVHCPVSNAVLGSGIAPLRNFMDQKIRLRLGTDGAASNDSQDCFENIKMALCLARASHLDANNVSTSQVLEMAFAGNHLIPGAEADITLVNLNSLSSSPVHDLDSALVLSARRDDVDTVIVAGEILYQDRKFLVLDEEILIKECNQAYQSLARRAGVSQ